ncbi:MAG: helix-turn-helix transcriptional regulator [Petrimonas sp.]|nr:helix-turn-helix transcriptional regulator [Petrimonas sp.]
MKVDLKKFREDKGLTQSQIGLMFGTGQANISMLEKDNRDITAEQYQILIAEYGEQEILKYVVNDDKPSNNDVVSISIEAWEMIKQQIQIISSQQEVIKSQQRALEFFSAKSDFTDIPPSANIG